MGILHRTDGVTRALPYWLSLLVIVCILIAAHFGGWALLLPPLASWGLFSILDKLIGKDGINPDTDGGNLFWHMAILRLWVPLQFLTLFALIAGLDRLSLSSAEAIGLFAGLGIVTGTIGITYAHELIHTSDAGARRAGDLLLGMVLYSHFRTEHLLGHHVHVATPRDPASARLGEGFWRFFLRAVPGGLISAWRIEAQRLRTRGRPLWHRSNPFWTYGGLQLVCLALAVGLGGLFGLILFLCQALVAVLQLELINYIEHYGLTRQKLPNGRYEPVRVHHSWNAAHTGSNWLLVNLQRHCDHHVAPMRPYPLLQTYDHATAPNLPFGYPVMGMLALFPSLWRRRMDPRVHAWRRRHYPGITDWDRSS